MIQKLVTEYDKNGVIVIKKLFTLKEVNYLKSKINSYIKKNSNKLRGKEINYIKKRINSIHKFKDPFFKKFSSQKKIFNIGKNLLKDSPKFRKCEYFAKPKKIGLASPLHQDNYYWNLKKGKGLTMWIAIDKSYKNNGTVKYLIKSHKKGLVEHEASFAPGSSQKVKNVSKYIKIFKIKKFNLNIGDCLVHHSEIIHGSDRNKSKYSRRGFTIQLVSKKETVNQTALKKYNISLRKQIAQRTKSTVH